MALSKYKLGDLIEQVSRINSDLKYGSQDVKGMTIGKEIIPTKADVKETDLTRFLVVEPNEFIYNPRTHGKKIGFGYNNTKNNFIISWNNIAFRIKHTMTNVVLTDYLFLHFKREEWDREACFQSWGSSTEVFSWDALTDMDIDLPPISIQQKYVDVYNAMLANQQSYERGLDDLKLVCDAYIENLKREISCEPIGPYIEEAFVKNTDAKYGSEFIKGISIKKEFIETKADTNDLSTINYKITGRGQFSFNPNTARMGDKFCIAYNNTSKEILVSAIYPVFEVKEKMKLCSEYLMMFFIRDEFDRYVRFNSWGSAREVFNFDDITQVKIPIPQYNVQRSIVNIYNTYNNRREINEKLKTQLKNICPILIKGSIEEARRNENVHSAV